MYVTAVISTRCTETCTQENERCVFNEIYLAAERLLECSGCGSQGNVYFATHTRTYKRWKIPGNTEVSALFRGSSHSIDPPLQQQAATLRGCFPLTPEASLTRQQPSASLDRVRSSPFDIPRHNKENSKRTLALENDHSSQSGRVHIGVDEERADTPGTASRFPLIYHNSLSYCFGATRLWSQMGRGMVPCWATLSFFDNSRASLLVPTFRAAVPTAVRVCLVLACAARV